MKITDLFIRRPVIAIVVNLLILIAGLQALRSLNVRQYPRTESAAITVTTAYIGANADLVRGFITTPLERALAAAEGIDYLESESTQGLSTIHAHLKLNYDATRALAEISSKVDQVRRDLPPEAEVPILAIESTETQFASAYLSFSSKFLAQNEITDYLVRIVQPRLSAIDGVQRADILGGRTFAMRIWLQPEKMAAFHLGPAEVRQALAANNYLAAVGQAKGQLIQINLKTNTDLRSVEEFENLIVRRQGDATVRLKDIAHVSLGAEDYDAEVRFSGETAVFIGVWTLPNANALDVIKRVHRDLDELQKEMPKEIEGRIAYDATSYIRSAITDVVRTLSETLLIVVVVIFLFLGSFRSVLVPVVAIPVSLIGAVFLMQAFGFTMNLLTLLAIVLSVGLVVDDAIVVVENVERHLREGHKPFDAAIIGARELLGPVIAMTITLAAVYVPIAFQGGLTGSLFREFALTLAGAVTISGIVAVTLSPVMSSRLLRESGERRGLKKWTNDAFEWLKRTYGRLLDATLASRPAVYTAWVAFAILAVVLFIMSPKELAPAEDQGVIFGVVNTPSNSTLEQVSVFTAAANQAMLDTPEAAFTFQITFPSGGFGGVGLVPWDDRDRSAFDILPELQAKLQAIPGVQIFPVVPPALPGGGQFPVELVIASTAETSEIARLAKQIADNAAKSGMFAFPPLLDTKLDQPQTELMIDRDKVADLGLNLQQVGQELAAAIGGNFVNRFNMSGRSYKVIPEITRRERLTPEQLGDLQIAGPEGRVIPLSSVATLRDTVQPRTLNHFQQLNSVKISGVAVAPLDRALSFLEQQAAQTLPSGYSVDYTGESRQLRTEGQRFLPAFSLAIVIIFLVLAAQFNSFRDPLIILLGSVPLAMFGALLLTFLKMPNPNTHFFTDRFTTTLNVYSQIGLVTLIGLVAKNGILIVNFANREQREGKNKFDAVHSAAMTRLRPILMTTAATVCGHFPLTLVTGPGAHARNSIGLVLVAGMSIGTLFTLFFVPSLYMLFAKTHAGEESGAHRPERSSLNSTLSPGLHG